MLSFVLGVCFCVFFTLVAWDRPFSRSALVFLCLCVDRLSVCVCAFGARVLVTVSAWCVFVLVNARLVIWVAPLA